MGFASWV